MKLLYFTTVLLLSLSAFSQDQIQYDNGTFSRNGEEISYEEIYELTNYYKVGKRDLDKALIYNYLSTLKTGQLRYNLALIAGIAYIGIGFVIWHPWDPNDTQGFIFDEGDFDPLGQTSVAIGTSLVVYGISKAGPSKKADKAFKSTALKLNEAILFEKS